MAMLRRTITDQPPAATDDQLDQQTLLQQLMGQPATTLPSNERVPTAPTAPVPYGDQPGSANTGITGGMDKSITGTTTGGATGAATNPAWDTDGYAAPAYTATDFGPVLPGWDDTKWKNANNQHPKYVVGRILSKYSPDDAGTQAAVQEIMKAYPGTTFDGKDKITVPGLGTIDFRVGAGVGGKGWQWDDGSAAGTSSQASRGLPVSASSSAPMANALTSGSTYQELMKRLQAILGTSAPDQMDQQTLLAQLAPQ